MKSGDSGKSLLSDDQKRPRGRSETYYAWRIAERFPSWFKRPDEVYLLCPDMFVQALSYELIREEEELLNSLRM